MSLRFETLRGAPWLLGSLLFVAAIGAVLAMIVGIGWWLLALAAVMLFFWAIPRRAQSSTVTAPRMVNGNVLPQPMESLVVHSHNGIEKQALLVPVPAETDHRLVLTTEGYAIVNQEGQIIHRLR